MYSQWVENIQVWPGKKTFWPSIWKIKPHRLHRVLLATVPSLNQSIANYFSENLNSKEKPKI